MKWRPYWCPDPILRELKAIIMLTSSFVFGETQEFICHNDKSHYYGSDQLRCNVIVFSNLLGGLEVSSMQLLRDKWNFFFLTSFLGF